MDEFFGNQIISSQKFVQDKKEKDEKEKHRSKKAKTSKSTPKHEQTKDVEQQKKKDVGPVKAGHEVDTPMVDLTGNDEISKPESNLDKGKNPVENFGHAVISPPKSNQTEKEIEKLIPTSTLRALVSEPTGTKKSLEDLSQDKVGSHMQVTPITNTQIPQLRKNTTAASSDFASSVKWLGGKSKAPYPSGRPPLDDRSLTEQYEELKKRPRVDGLPIDAMISDYGAPESYSWSMSLNSILPAEQERLNQASVRKVVQSGSKWLQFLEQHIFNLGLKSETEAIEKIKAQVELAKAEEALWKAHAEVKVLKQSLQSEKDYVLKQKEAQLATEKSKFDQEMDQLRVLLEQAKEASDRREKEAYDRGYAARSAELKKIFEDNKLI